MPVRRRHIANLVERLLRENEIEGPPVPVDRIAKSEGIEIVRPPFEGDEISGFLYREGKRAIIGINKQHPLNRQRFTIAHELGHFLLHNEGIGEVHVDRSFQVKLRSGQSSEGTDIDEIEANAFAAELLMPEDFIHRDLANRDFVDLFDEDDWKELAQAYGVSLQALHLRLARLGYAP